MIKGLKSLFGGAAASPARKGPTPREAASALLVETAMCDGIFDDIEAGRMVRALSHAFGIDKPAAESLVFRGEELVRESVDHYRFTRVVKEQMEEAERLALVEHLWAVALADGVNTAEEDSFIRRICPLLAIDDRARILARQRAEARKGQD